MSKPPRNYFISIGSYFPEVCDSSNVFTSTNYSAKFKTINTDERYLLS